jgi:hypothetical protein
MNKDFLCKCDHKFSSHELIDDGYTVCKECWDSDRTIICDEHFIPDNLKYLESKI